MRDILPIAHFERIQLSNWRSQDLGMSAFDICNKIVPLRDQLENNTVETSCLLSADFILDLNSKLALALDNCRQPEFQNAEEWQVFMNELTAEFDISEMPFRESGTYILSVLFSTHLRTLRLLTSWLVIDALAKVLNQPRLSISQTGLGLLLRDLSVSGPPVYDAEDMRGAFPERYC